MIVELAIGAATLVVAGAIARAVAARRTRLAARPALEAPRKREASDDELEVGDVLLYLDDSLLLAGCLEIDEGGRPLRLFATPQSQSATWVLDASEDRALFFLRESEELPLGSLPDRLPLAGRVLQLARRGRGAMRGEGEQLPPLGPKASYTLLTDIGGRAALVIELDAERRLALVGERIDRRLVQKLPGS